MRVCVYVYVCVYKCVLRVNIDQVTLCAQTESYFNSTVVAPLVRLYLALILKQTALKEE